MRVTLKYFPSVYSGGYVVTTTGRWRIQKDLTYCSLSLEGSYDKKVAKKKKHWWSTQEYKYVTVTEWLHEDDLILSVHETFVNECTGGCDEEYSNHK